MKKSITLILAVILCIGAMVCGCAKKADDGEIDKACEILGERWKEVYDESPFAVGDDRHLEIKNTRIVHIKDTGLEELENVDYVIDFVLFTNYTGTAPYYTVSDFYNTVTVYKDGTMNQDTDVFAIFTGAYGNDFEKLVKSVEDCEAEYNRVIKVKS